MKRSSVGRMSALLCVSSSACAPSGPPIKVDAAELAGAYLSNAPAAQARFRGHPLIVTGVSGGVDASNALTLVPGAIADIRGDSSSVGFGSSVTVKCESVSPEENAVHLKGYPPGGAAVREVPAQPPERRRPARGARHPSGDELKLD